MTMKETPGGQGSWESRPTFGKYVLVFCGTINFGLAISLPVSLSVMFLDWQESFGVSRAHTAAVHSTCVGILFGGGVCAGWLMNKFGARFTCLLGATLATLGLFVGFFANSIDYLIATTGVISGFGFCLLQLPCIPCITLPFTQYKSLCISICTFGAALFNMIFPHFYRFLVNQYSWRGAYVIISGLAMNTFVTGLAMTSTTRSRRTSSSPAHPTDQSISITSTDHHCNKDDKVNEKLNREVNVVVISLVNSNHTDKGHATECNRKEHPTFYSPLISNVEEDHEEIKNNYLQNGNTVSEDISRTVNGKTEDIIKKSKTRYQISTISTLCTHSLNFGHFSKTSEWRFLTDPMYILYLMFLGTCLSSIFACYILLMDLSKTKGFTDESTGVLFIMITAIASLCGRVLVGFMNLTPRLHSFVILCSFGGAASVAMTLLGSVTDFAVIVSCLLVIGSGIGGMFAIYPKCILDLSTVDSRSYPLALGFTCTSEGIFDFFIPITIGLMVDVSGNYFMPFTILGSLAMLMTVTLLTAFCIRKRHPV
ncbi:unnamed protein product [Lymnaea stagnalis]|uniref:Uncharacterized protein n=1 Tax=Lymnaea stagnalis TaxID=6523 RepID=A0AAV2HLT9_LYMST